MPKNIIQLALALAALSAAAVAIVACALSPLFHLEVSMSSSRGGNAGVLYDIGAGINGRDSTQLPLQAEPRTLYRFPLPEAEYRTLQFHPVDRDNAEKSARWLLRMQKFQKLPRRHNPHSLVFFYNEQIIIAGNDNICSPGNGHTEDNIVVSVS